jgi:cyclic beta-1,2-glucan synthetase
VSPDDDVEIRRLTLTNHGLFARQLSVISVAELALAPHDADRAHPPSASSSFKPKLCPSCRL